MQSYLLENIQRVQTELRLEQHCMDWILDFMSSIDALMMESSHEKDIALYCDILFISVISLSGMDCLLPRKELLITSQNVRIRLFPQAISMLADRQIWKSTTRQVFVILCKLKIFHMLHSSYNFLFFFLMTKNVLHINTIEIVTGCFAKRTIH